MKVIGTDPIFSFSDLTRRGTIFISSRAYTKKNTPKNYTHPALNNITLCFLKTRKMAS